MAYISFKLLQKDPKANLIVAPSDHLILEADEFVNTAKKGLSFVSNSDAIITLGIKPTYPNTGYGYIQHETTEATTNIYKVKTFTENPI